MNVATRSLERDLERLKADHATEVSSWANTGTYHLTHRFQLENAVEKYKGEISDNKKKQWVRILTYSPPHLLTSSL